MKKIGIGILLLLFCFCLSGCGCEKEKYHVSFDTDGGSRVSTVEVEKNGTVTKPDDPTKEGYIFDGWYLNDTKYDFNTKVTTNITLKAKWKEVNPAETEEYTVTFDSNGGSEVASQTIASGKLATEPSNPTKDGYIFDGWIYNDEPFDFKTPITGDITLTAAWKKAEVNSTETKKYTVTFNSNGGSKVKSQTVVSGKLATRPSNPTKEGYTFDGWTYNGKLFDFKTKITKNITLTAVWKKLEVKPTEEKKYTVTFDSNGGSSVASQTVKEGGKATKPSNPTKEGYTFNGWYLDNTEYKFTESVTRNITLVAKWTKNAPKLEIKKEIYGDVGQIRIILLANGIPTKGYADITYISGNVVRIEIPVDGLIRHGSSIKDITNLNLEK